MICCLNSSDVSLTIKGFLFTKRTNKILIITFWFLQSASDEGFKEISSVLVTFLRYSIPSLIWYTELHCAFPRDPYGVERILTCMLTKGVSVYFLFLKWSNNFANKLTCLPFIKFQWNMTIYITQQIFYYRVGNQLKDCRSSPRLGVINYMLTLRHGRVYLRRPILLIPWLFDTPYSDQAWIFQTFQFSIGKLYTAVFRCQKDWTLLKQ